MKISSSQMFKEINKWCFAALALLLASSASVKAQDGAALFSAKCASCHQPHKNSTGPKLFEVRQKWEAGGAKEGSIYNWVHNWSSAAATDPYAQQMVAWSPTAMTFFPDLSNEEIDAIFDWVDAQPAGPVGPEDPTPGNTSQVEESSFNWIWVILGVVFIIIIMAVGGVRRQLKIANGEIRDEDYSYMESFRGWAWKYRLYVGLTSLVLVLAIIVSLFLAMYDIGVVENYQPSQPIEFPHDIHAGKNGIDCKYCHNSVTKSRTAGIPSVNVCMNCHKQVTGTTPEQQQKIGLIYDAAGYSSEGAGSYGGKMKEIVWNKVHVLPDHVYFNHQQHVVVGGIDCKQCHGDMTTMSETAKVQPVSELNKIEGNVQLTRPTLTMGWCIECHAAKEISNGSIDSKGGGYYAEIHSRLLKDKSLYNSYLEDGKVTVQELGGWECAKCHY